MSVEARPDPYDRSTLRTGEEELSKPSAMLDGSQGTSPESGRAAESRQGPEVYTPEPVTPVQPRGPADSSRLRTTDPPGSDELVSVESDYSTAYSEITAVADAVRSPGRAGPDRPGLPDEERATDSDPDAELEAIRERIHADAAERDDRLVDGVCAEYGIESPEQISALRKAQGVLAETVVPFAVEGAHRMLDRLRAEVEKRPDTIIAVTCRDGRSLGMAIAEIDPEFYRSYCRPVQISRRCMEHVLQDLEDNTGKTFPEVEKMRDRTMIDPGRVPGAALRTQRHMLDSGVPVTTPGANIIFIDSGARGTIQEQVTAAWSKPNYSSEFLHHVEFEHDPHKGTKTGHFLHMSADRIEPADPDDPARIFADKLPGVVFEDLLHGPMSSTIGHDERGNPVYAAERSSADQIVPSAISPEYSDSNIRMAIMDIAQRSVSSRARTVAELADAGIDYRQDLIEEARAYTRKVQSWVYGHDTGDPAFDELADSFVRREDKHLIPRLRTATSDFDEVAQTAVWRGYLQLPLADRERYVEQYERPPGSTAPEGSSDG